MATSDHPSSPPTFAEVFSAAVQARSLPLDRIQARLAEAGVPVSVATLSYWQTGRSKPRRAASMRAVAELETVLRLEPGHLLSTLDSTTVDPWDPLSVLPVVEVVQRALGEMGLDLTEQWASSSVHDTVMIDADGHESEQRCRQIQRAERDGIRSWPIIYQQDGPEPSAPVIEGTHCCTVERSVQIPEHRITIVEMVAPRVLHKGDWLMTEHRVQWAPTGVKSHQVCRLAPNEMRELVLEAVFLGDLPRDLTRFHRRTYQEAERQDIRPITPVGNVVQSITTSAAVGVHGIGWQW